LKKVREPTTGNLVVGTTLYFL